MSVWRLVKVLIPLLLIAAGMLWPLAFRGDSSGGAPAADPVVLTRYDVDIRVDAAGDLTAVETITGQFPGDRHGIFRYWDVANQNSPRVRQVPEVTSILMDGRPAPYQMLSEGGGRFVVAKIGDPDRYLSYGTHVFEIRYTIPGVLDPSEDDPDSVFFWNVIAPAWNNEIRRANVSVTLPSAVDGAQCWVGFGAGTPCLDLAVRDNRVTFSAADLAPRTPVTVRAGVELPPPPRAEVPWPYYWDRILGQSPTGVAWILGVTVLAGLAALLWLRTIVEKPPGFPLQYAPPDGLGPVQTEYIRTESVPKTGLTATLFHLAERGLVELRQVDDTQWNVEGIAEPARWRDVDPVSAAVAAALKVDRRGKPFQAEKTAAAGKKLSQARSEMTTAVKKWAVESGYMVTRKRELWLRAANAAAFVAMVCAFFRWGFPTTMSALPFAAFFLFSTVSWRDGVGTRRTRAGRELWSRAGGFHRVLSTDSAESRFDFAARRDLYTAYVPYAVAAGVAALWAKKYHAETGLAAPQPEWYGASVTSHSSADTAAGGADADFDSFESALASSIGAYTASQASSSSGSSSSFGGGGGGGGGGGSW
ncbi:DUF2207 domain-containing protein [Mycobacterium sp. SMC-4]|uniref:DUF2207 domain-containing protein n=1 Tax=Mycobacterium sp. SMC-4 TaxID=2857059 RepID=UPI003D065EEF